MQTHRHRPAREYDEQYLRRCGECLDGDAPGWRSDDICLRHDEPRNHYYRSGQPDDWLRLWGTGFGTTGDALVRMTDARGNAYDFTYDLLGRKTAMIYRPDTVGGTALQESWTFNAVGNPLTYTTRAGQVKTCSYDVRNRDILCDWSDTTPDVSKTYDAAGRVLTMTSSVSALSYTYDAANQMLSETQDLQSQVDLPAKTVSYTYDADGNRAALTYPDATVVTTTYTGRNQIKTISAGNPPPMATFTYDLAGNRTGKTLENSTSTAYAYDNAGRLLSVNHLLSGVSFQSFAYGLNAVGNRTARTESNSGTAQTDTYGYDAIDQVTQTRYNVTNAGADEARKTASSASPGRTAPPPPWPTTRATVA